MHFLMHFLLPSHQIKKNNEAIYFISAPTPADIAYSNLTGRFPVQSSRGNNYLMCVYYPDANAILVTALKNRTAPKITKA